LLPAGRLAGASESLASLIGFQPTAPELTPAWLPGLSGDYRCSPGKSI